LAKQLAGLRNKGGLILGSGNMLHNLWMLDWNQPDGGTSWAMEANEIFKSLIRKDDHQSLIDFRKLGNAVQLAIPTPEHYLPLLYSLVLQGKDDELSFLNDKAVMGSRTMTSFWIR